MAMPPLSSKRKNKIMEEQSNYLSCLTDYSKYILTQLSYNIQQEDAIIISLLIEQWSKKEKDKKVKESIFQKEKQE
jgi:hypothetical protein